MNAIASEYARWLGSSNVPKLFLKAEPGAILANDRLINLVRGWPALTEKTVAKSISFRKILPDEIGKFIVDWIESLERPASQQIRRRSRLRRNRPEFATVAKPLSA